nr:hypothetical protein [Tanacetum cinerariifolium]
PFEVPHDKLEEPRDVIVQARTGGTKTVGIKSLHEVTAVKVRVNAANLTLVMFRTDGTCESIEGCGSPCTMTSRGSSSLSCGTSKGTAFGFHPFSVYPSEKRLTTKEIVGKFINKEK